MKIGRIIKTIKKNTTISNIIFRLLSSWLILFVINLLYDGTYNNLEFVNNINFSASMILFILIFTFISISSIVFNKYKIDYYISLLSYIGFSLISIRESNGIFYIITLLLFFILLYNYKLNKINLSRINLDDKPTKYTVLLIGIIMFLIIAITGVLRYRNFLSPNFDLGIPAQNFYYLKKLLIPLSTCERDVLISHFAIHISPIYYLIVPIYSIFTSAETLQVVSGLIIASAIIPIYLLAKKRNLPNYVILIICLIFGLYAPAICSTYYDFHENHFLIPLLLWLFYSYERKNKPWFIILCILIWSVKEDASLYLVFFGIYMLFNKDKRNGLLTILFGIGGFLFSTTLLKYFGSGIMSDRYNNLIPQDSGLFGIIRTIIINPGYFINQLTLSNGNSNIQKIIYILEIFLPLGFLPFKSKNWKNYLLLFPLLLTIMTTYEYSYSIDFHYTCGIIAFVFYLFIMNISELKKYNYLFICLFGTLLIFMHCSYNPLVSNIYDYKEHLADRIMVERVLKSIPENASVSASTFILPHLANRDVIYEVYYHDNKDDVEYVVLDARFDDYMPFYEAYIAKGYHIYKEIDRQIIVLKK